MGPINKLISILLIINLSFNVRETKTVANGSFVPFGQFKSVVNIMYTDLVDNKTGHPLCTGNIINNFWVLTACHCFRDVDINRVFVIAGDNDRRKDDTTEQIRFIEKFICHPLHNEWEWGHDLAVIKVWQEFKFNDFIQPALFDQDVKSNADRMIFIGWGKTHFESNESSNQLQKFETEIVNSTNCGVEEYILCATSQSNDSAACQADSGGGIFRIDSNQNQYLHGTLIGSQDNPNCSTGYHTSLFVNLRLPINFHWIGNVTSVELENTKDTEPRKNGKSWVSNHLSWSIIAVVSLLALSFLCVCRFFL